MNLTAVKIQLTAGAGASYKKRHDAIWLALQAVFPESRFGVKSIFLDELSDSLIGIFILEDAVILPDILQTPIVQKWWDCLREIRDINSAPMEMPLVEIQNLHFRSC